MSEQALTPLQQPASVEETIRALIADWRRGINGTMHDAAAELEQVLDDAVRTMAEASSQLAAEVLGRHGGSIGHALAREQITRHGVDRFPTVEGQLKHLAGEVVELAAAVGTYTGTREVLPATALDHWAHLRREYADVGLSLNELGNKLGLDLVHEMADLVAADERTFTEVHHGE